MALCQNMKEDKVTADGLTKGFYPTNHLNFTTRKYRKLWNVLTEKRSSGAKCSWLDWV